MKKILFAVIVSASVLGATMLQGAVGTVTYSLGGKLITNTITGPVKLLSVTIQADTTNQSFALLDAPSLVFTNVIPSFTSYAQYATNYPFLYTNFFGATNTYTNTLIYTNWTTTAGTTNNWPTKLSGSSASNTTAIFNNINTLFLQGILVTNPATSGNATITLQYEK